MEQKWPLQNWQSPTYLRGAEMQFLAEHLFFDFLLGEGLFSAAGAFSDEVVDDDEDVDEVIGRDVWPVV